MYGGGCACAMEYVHTMVLVWRSHGDDKFVELVFSFGLSVGPRD